MSGQEVSCDDCGDFRPKIWNEAFSNNRTMNLVKYVLATAKELGTDEVCSDTSRSLLKFIEMAATSETAHYTLKMIIKMSSALLNEATLHKDDFAALRVVFERIYTDAKIRDFVAKYVNYWLELLANPVNRKRVYELAKGVETITRPSKAEVEVKKTLKSVKNLVTNPIKNMIKIVNKV